MSVISEMLSSLVFVALAAMNMIVILESENPSRRTITKSRLMALHKLGGYLFLSLFCIIVYSMSEKLAGVGMTGHLPTYLVFHIVLVLVLVPLVLLKVLVARRYKQRHSLLAGLGVSIFVVSFVLVAIPALSEALGSVSPAGVWSRLAAGLAVAACLAQCALILSKVVRSRVSKNSFCITDIPTSADSRLTGNNNVESPITLLLTHVEEQTHDTKTLRFKVLKGKRYVAKPGQFLTFHWTIDGQRVSRSYTISSSPTREEYVEITAKRKENGRVSVFLNDCAKPGLEVEASGPYGRFYFDETHHRTIVLIAAGSGITPMMSMLSYIDDLILTNPVRLLYCVRSPEDIIFGKELARLRESLPNFDYEVCLSQPGLAWAGHSGRLTQEFVSQHVNNLDSPTFFLCGPKGFMESARQILSNLGIGEDRILQESFGESKCSTDSGREEARSADRVVFMHSQKICEVSAGSTLLETAEKNGVQIPYGCRLGICGTCATRMLSGSIQMEVEAGLTIEQKNSGYVLPCVSRIKGTVVVAA